MFKISPIQSPELQKECAKQCNTNYKEGSFGYSMNDSDTGRLMGFSQFEITENGGKLIDLRPADGYEDYDITNTQYVEDIDENTTGTLGVNCNKGKMYLSKSLTS